MSGKKKWTGVLNVDEDLARDIVEGMEKGFANLSKVTTNFADAVGEAFKFIDLKTLSVSMQEVAEIAESADDAPPSAGLASFAQPCLYCDKPTTQRDQTGQPAHMTCALWS